MPYKNGWAKFSSQQVAELFAANVEEGGFRMQIAQLKPSAERIDLGIGQPDPALLPTELVRRAVEHRLQHADPEILQYGCEAGNGFFRTALSGFLNANGAGPLTPDRLMVTAGVTGALELICTALTRPGDTIFVEEPTYFLALRLFADRHLNLVGVPTDDHGLMIEALEARLAEHRPAILYTIPVYHNPSGVTLSETRRRKLVALSRSHAFTIVADEVYQFLSYGEPPPPPLATMADDDRVLSLGSFSKILAPGLRLGWIQTSRKTIEKLSGSGVLLSGGGNNPFTAALVQSALELGLQQQYLGSLVAAHRRRSEALVSALHRHLPGSVSFRPPEGGYFVWLRLPPELDASRMLKAARDAGLGFQPGARFSPDRSKANCLRLCFVHYGEETLREGARRLGRLLRNLPQ